MIQLVLHIRTEKMDFSKKSIGITEQPFGGKKETNLV